MKNLSLLILALFLSTLCKAQTSTPINWDADIDFLGTELPQKHCDFFAMKDKNSFLTGLDKIKRNSAELTDFEVAIQLQQLIASFGDSHTHVSFGQNLDKNNILPLHLYWFSDGLFILHTTQENREILGHQIVSINGVPLKTITDSLSTLLTQENHAIIKNDVPKLLPLLQILDYFGFVKDQSIALGLKDVNGMHKTFQIQPAVLTRQNRNMYTPDSLALCYKNERAFFIDYYQATDKLYYLQYNRCWSKELELQHGNAQKAERMPSFTKFDEKVFQTLNRQSINKVVFDLRFNGGGNSRQGTAFIEKYARFLEAHPTMKTYVIIGRRTFSSAILNVMDFKRLTNAVIIGEETAGKPNHFGEVRKFQLPSSGISISYSTKYFQRTGDNEQTIAPEITADASFSEFSHGIDPAYEWIKKH